MNPKSSARTVIVTGSGRNIGREIAIEFAKQGTNVALCTSKNIAGLEETAHHIQQHGVRVIAKLCDVTDHAAVASFVSSTRAELGSVDIVVNNATLRSDSDMLETSVEDWMKNVAVNLHGPYFVCREVLPLMIEQRWGRIINFSGVAAFRGASAGKAMVKLGIIGFTRGIAKQYGKYNITANCISPGLIAVERDPGKWAPSLRSDQAIRRPGTAGEVADLVWFLASDRAGYISGQCYHINGGDYLQ